MNSPSRRFLQLFLTLSAISLISLTALAQSTNRQIGTQFEVTADPVVPRPFEKPCTVQLFSDFTFAHFSQTTQTFSFAPPADCPGPWEKVVFEADFSENAGDQFDRTATMFLGNTNIYFGTTPEPLQTATNTWHVERDVTDYTALLSLPQAGTIVLQNCTSDCGAPYNTLNGVFTVSADIEFYPARHGWNQPEVPDVILPMVQTTSSGINLPAYLDINSSTTQFTTTFTLPANIERAYLDVIAQGQQSDEPWYGCLPNDLANINEVYGCGNTDFRETDITIDGQPAGVAPVSPWVFTGFLPDVWVPSPGVQTLDFVPYRVNLTPFAGLLSNGQPHTVSLSVFDANYYFSSAASLLLYLDHGSKQVTGAVTKNTLGSPSPVVTENLQGTSTVTGTIGVTSNREFTIEGYVNTSRGKVTTRVDGRQNFSSTQTIDFDTVNFTVADQKTSVQNRLSTITKVQSNLGTTVSEDDFSFPITVDFIYPVASAEFGQTVATGQDYQYNRQVWLDGFPLSFSLVNNSGQGTDVSPAASWQHYTSFDSTGQFYDCKIASKNNTLADVSQGCNAGKK
jgi:hypothetical protein